MPEGHHYRHLDEGLDDMPAHVKASFFWDILCRQMQLNGPLVEGLSITNPPLYILMLVVQSSLMGPSLNIPIQQGRLALGTWQGEMYFLRCWGVQSLPVITCHAYSMKMIAYQMPMSLPCMLSHHPIPAMHSLQASI